jgi:hypothetical protein
MQFRQGAKFLEEFARRIRKYGGGLWCTTQNSDDFLRSEEGRTILAMATMKYLMKQDATTIESVTNTFRLSPGQRNFLLGARRGEGLFATRTWTPMEVVASPAEAVMANTTLGVKGQTAQIDASEVLWENFEEAKDQSTSPVPVAPALARATVTTVTPIAVEPPALPGSVGAGNSRQPDGQLRSLPNPHER